MRIFRQISQFFGYSKKRYYNDGDECSICLDCENKDIITICGHTFHSKCLNQWKIREVTCPICRAYLDICKNDSFKKEDIDFVMRFFRVSRTEAIRILLKHPDLVDAISIY